MSAYLQSLRQAVAKAKQLPRGSSLPRVCGGAPNPTESPAAFSSQTPAQSPAGEGARSGRPPVTAGSTYRKWSWDEDLILRRMVKTGYSFREIGTVLERTKDSCIGRFHRLAAREVAR